MVSQHEEEEEPNKWEIKETMRRRGLTLIGTPQKAHLTGEFVVVV